MRWRSSGSRPLEQRHAAEQEHRLEVAEGATRLRHLRPSCRAPRASGARSTDRHHRAAGAHDGIAILRVADLVLEQPDERAGQSSIAGRIERLDRLRPDLGVVRSKAAAEDATGLRRTEDHQRAERLVLDPAARGCRGRRTGRRASAGPASSRRAPHRPGPSEPGGGGPLARAPSIVQPMTVSRTSGPWPRRASRAASWARGEPWSRTSVTPAGVVSNPASAAAAACRTGAASSSRAATIAGAEWARSRERRQRLDGGDTDPGRWVAEQGAGGVDRGRVAQPADGGEARHARLRVGILEQLGDEPLRAGVRAARSEQAGHRGANGRARVAGERPAAWGSPPAPRRRPPRRASGSRRRGRGRPGRTGTLRRRRRRSAGRRARAIASSAATRTVGSGSSSTAATSAAPAPSTDVRPRDVRPSRSAAIRRVLGCGALSASTSAAMTAGSAVSTARPGPPSRTCSPSPARSVRSRLAA